MNYQIASDYLTEKFKIKLSVKKDESSVHFHLLFKGSRLGYEFGFGLVLEPKQLSLD